MFSKVLIANRGIVQANCIRAVKELGARAAVLYVASERQTIGVRMADEAYELLSPEVGLEYYDEDAIVRIAKEIGADAVHPGYGFLAQNVSFSHKLAAEGICLISSDVDDRQRGITDKPAIKDIAKKHSIPVIPGSGACRSLSEARNAAKELGYPVVIKAVAGYGGRGIRIVTKESQLAAAYEAVVARTETLRLSSRDVFVERYITSARHIEFPVIRDHLGNVVLLPELDSSIQRRFQKLVVETPSPTLDPALLKQLGGASRRLVEKLDFVGFASVEYLVREKEAWLLEVNGYIQPAHIATHQLTGIDIIKEQIRILAGEVLPFSQQDVWPRGHAISLSINAEDPLQNFAPSPGVLKRFELLSGMGSTVHATLGAGEVVPSFYAPTIAQAVFHDRTREEVIEKALVGLAGYFVEGVKTNLPFLRAILSSSAFVGGEMNLSYIMDRSNMKKLLEETGTDEEEDIASLLAVVAIHEDANAQRTLDEAQKSGNYSIWNFASRLLNRNTMEF